MNIKFLTFAALMVWLGVVSTSAQNQPFPVPDSFVDKKHAPAPPNLPAKFQIPTFTRIDVAAQRKTPRPPVPANDPLAQGRQKQRLLWMPDLISAVIERNARDVQVTYQWEGGTTSNAYVVGGTSFWLACLKYPNYVISAHGSAIGYSFKAENSLAPGVSGGSSGDFPGLGWYTPGSYSGQATFDGAKVLVFQEGATGKSADPQPASAKPSAAGDPPQIKLYVDAKSLRPLLYDAGDMLYMFTYSPDPTAKVNPVGVFATVINRYLAAQKALSQPVRAPFKP